MSLEPPPTGHPGVSYVLKMETQDEDKKVVVEKDNQTVFPVFGSYLVFNIKTTLERLIEDHKKELDKYNQAMTKHKIPLRIRVMHTTVSRGNKYVYCGRYLYRKMSREKEKYIGKFDNTLLRQEIQEKWNKIGSPPKHKLDGLRYRIVYVGGKESDHVIVPAEMFNNIQYKSIFEGKTFFKIA